LTYSIYFATLRRTPKKQELVKTMANEQALKIMTEEARTIAQQLVAELQEKLPKPIPDNYDTTNPYLACKYGDMATLRALLLQNEYLDSDLRNFLQKAVEHGQIAITDFLLHSGVDIHEQEEYPLELAAKFGQTEMVLFLLERGADIHGDDGQILDWATRADGEPNIETIAVLIEKGASLEALPPQYLADYEAYRAEQLANPKKTLQTGQDLAEIFNAQTWVGHVPAMVKLWQQIPEPLQDKFDFQHAFADAQIQTLKQCKPKIRLIK
jgi:hypothetical protein